MKAAGLAATALFAAMPLAAGSVAVAQHAAISTASPDATRVGLSIMKRGGNAIDAAIAAASAIASTAGGFLVYYDGATQSVWTLDFNSCGTAAGLAAMHERFGSLELAKSEIGNRNDAKPVWRAPVKVVFREYEIYTLPPPSSAGLMLGEELNILSGFDLKGADAARRIHLFAEAERRAAFDRDRLIADPSSIRAPFRDALSLQRANQWRASIDPKRATPTPTLGETIPPPLASGAATTHFSIIDASGNVAAVTLNLNEAVVPHSRITSSAAPAIVLRRGRPFLVVGTDGGVSMPNFVLQTFLDVVLFGKSLPDAVAALRFDQQASPDDITFETRKMPAETAAKLRAMGHGMREVTSLGDMYALAIDAQRITAVADPRHGGAAGGY